MQLFEFEKKRKQLIEVNRLIDHELKSNFFVSNFSALEIAYINSSSLFFKLYLFLAVITSLRFADLYNLELNKINSLNSIQVVQHKTKRIKSLNFSQIDSNLLNAISSIVSFSSLFNYEQLRKEIKRLNLLLNRNAVFNYSSKSHLFRHLRATALFNSGAKSSAIANQLGHLDLNSQSYYIHTAF